MNNFSDSQVRWGIIGVGDVCEVKSAPAMKLIANSDIVAVMRRNPEKAGDYAQRHQIKKWCSDADELIGDPAVNAIYISTPPAAHLEYTLKAAKAGKPVYVEKPMARSYTECLQMLNACKAAEVPLYVAYYRRALPNFLKVKELLEDKAIGEVRLVEVQLIKEQTPDIVSHLDNNWRVNPDIAGGGYFFDLGSHQLDLLDFLFGPITEVKGFARNQAGTYQAEDIVTGIFGFKSGMLGTGSWCFTADKSGNKDITTIVGSKGEISFATFGEPTVTLRTNEGIQTFTFEQPKHIQQPLIEQVVSELLGRGTCVSTGISGARTNRVMAEMVSSYINHKTLLKQ